MTIFALPDAVLRSYFIIEEKANMANVPAPGPNIPSYPPTRNPIRRDKKKTAFLDKELEWSSSPISFFRKMTTAAIGRISKSIVLRTWSGIIRTIDAAIPDPMKELNAARSEDLRLTAPADQNLKTDRVVPHALENLLHPYAKCAGIPVKT